MEKREWRIVQCSKKAGTVIKTISLDTDIAEHLAKQPNVSDYIRKLVKQDMKLPSVSGADFSPGAPLFRIYHTFQARLKRKRGERISYADFKGFPQQMETSELNEMFEEVETSLQFDIDNIRDEQVRNQCQDALNYLVNAREQNSLNDVYQQLYVYWLKEKQKDY